MYFGTDIPSTFFFINFLAVRYLKCIPKLWMAFKPSLAFRTKAPVTSVLEISSSFSITQIVSPVSWVGIKVKTRHTGEFPVSRYAASTFAVFLLSTPPHFAYTGVVLPSNSIEVACTFPLPLKSRLDRIPANIGRVGSYSSEISLKF